VIRMADQIKISERDATLVNVLERLADQISKQELLLEDVIRRQNELAESVASSELHQDFKQNEAETSHKKLSESFHRYRSDMLKLVNEQDSMNKSIADLYRSIDKFTYAIDLTNHKLADFDEWRAKQDKSLTEHIEYTIKKADFDQWQKKHDKSLNEHYEITIKQVEMFPKTIDEASRNVTKLHMDTEKAIEKMHSETKRQLGSIQSETMRRLLALDGIESTLQTLLIRTEPPEKKPNWIVSQCKKTGVFFRHTFTSLFRKLRFLFKSTE